MKKVVKSARIRVDYQKWKRMEKEIFFVAIFDRSIRKYIKVRPYLFSINFA